MNKNLLWLKLKGKYSKEALAAALAAQFANGRPVATKNFKAIPLPGTDEILIVGTDETVRDNYLARLDTPFIPYKNTAGQMMGSVQTVLIDAKKTHQHVFGVRLAAVHSAMSLVTKEFIPQPDPADLVNDIRFQCHPHFTVKFANVMKVGFSGLAPLNPRQLVQTQHQNGTIDTSEISRYTFTTGYPWFDMIPAAFGLLSPYSYMLRHGLDGYNEIYSSHVTHISSGYTGTKYTLRAYNDSSWNPYGITLPRIAGQYLVHTAPTKLSSLYRPTDYRTWKVHNIRSVGFIWTEYGVQPLIFTETAQAGTSPPLVSNGIGLGTPGLGRPGGGGSGGAGEGWIGDGTGTGTVGTGTGSGTDIGGTGPFKRMSSIGGSVPNGTTPVTSDSIASSTQNVPITLPTGNGSETVTFTPGETTAGLHIPRPPSGVSSGSSGESGSSPLAAEVDRLQRLAEAFGRQTISEAAAQAIAVGEVQASAKEAGRLNTTVAPLPTATNTQSTNIFGPVAVITAGATAIVGSAILAPGLLASSAVVGGAAIAMGAYELLKDPEGNWHQITSTVSNLSESVKQAVGDAVVSDTAALMRAYDMLSNAARTAAQAVANAVNNPVETAQNAVDRVTNAINETVQSASDAWDEATESVEDWWNEVQREVDEATDAASDWWNEVTDEASEALDNLLTPVEEAIEEALRRAREAIEEMLNELFPPDEEVDENGVPVCPRDPAGTPGLPGSNPYPGSGPATHPGGRMGYYSFITNSSPDYGSASNPYPSYPPSTPVDPMDVTGTPDFGGAGPGGYGGSNPYVPGNVYDGTYSGGLFNTPPFEPLPPMFVPSSGIPFFIDELAQHSEVLCNFPSLGLCIYTDYIGFQNTPIDGYPQLRRSSPYVFHIMKYYWEAYGYYRGPDELVRAYPQFIPKGINHAPITGVPPDYILIHYAFGAVYCVCLYKVPTNYAEQCAAIAAQYLVDNDVAKYRASILSMVTIKVNNFASAELIASIHAPGEYAILPYTTPARTDP